MSTTRMSLNGHVISTAHVHVKKKTDGRAFVGLKVGWSRSTAAPQEPAVVQLQGNDQL